MVVACEKMIFIYEALNAHIGENKCKYARIPESGQFILLPLYVRKAECSMYSEI